jgi:hypothetical protein
MRCWHPQMTATHTHATGLLALWQNDADSTGDKVCVLLVLGVQVCTLIWAQPGRNPLAVAASHLLLLVPVSCTVRSAAAHSLVLSALLLLTSTSL